MRRKNTFLACCLTMCLAVGMTVAAPVSAAAKTSASAETQQTYPKYETYYVVNLQRSITLRPQPDVTSGELCAESLWFSGKLY